MTKSEEMSFGEAKKNYIIMLGTVRCTKTCRESSRRLRLPQITRLSARVGGKVFSPTHRPHLPLVHILVGG